MICKADTATIDIYSTLRDDVQVRGSAYINNSLLYDNAIIEGQATFLNSTASNLSRVSDYAYVNVSEIYNNSHIYGRAKVVNIIVMGNSCVFGRAALINAMLTRSKIILHGHSKFGGDANFAGLKTLSDFINKYGEDKVTSGGTSVYNVEQVILTDIWDMGS